MKYTITLGANPIEVTLDDQDLTVRSFGMRRLTLEEAYQLRYFLAKHLPSGERFPIANDDLIPELEYIAADLADTFRHNRTTELLQMWREDIVNRLQSVIAGLESSGVRDFLATQVPVEGNASTENEDDEESLEGVDTEFLYKINPEG